MTTPRSYRTTRAIVAGLLVCGACGAAIEYERCRSATCQTFTSSVPKSAEAAGTVITTDGAYNGGTASAWTIRAVSPSDSWAEIASASPEGIEQYRTLLKGWTDVRLDPWS